MDRVMGGVALGSYLVFIGLSFGVRAVLHRRRTGSAGFNGMRGRVGSAQWWAGVSFTAARVAALVAPALQMLDVVDPVADSWITRSAGAVLAALGIVAVLWAQGAMGNSWRIGVDPAETTGLVTTGPWSCSSWPSHCRCGWSRSRT